MRLTKTEPCGNFDAALNLFFCKDGTTWVRGGGPGPEYANVKLDDWIRHVISTLDADVQTDGMDDEELNTAMAELAIFNELETVEDLIALFYNAAWAFSLLNARLMEYENTGLSPEEVIELKARMEGLEK